MNPDQHAPVCEDRWKNQLRLNADLETRLRRVEAKLLTISAIGGCLGALLGNLLN